MKFNKIECDGKFILDIRPIAGVSNERGRLLYDDTGNPLTEQMKFNNGVGWATLLDDGHMGPGSGIDADFLDGYNSGNASGEIPISNGVKCVDLNCDLFDDETGSFYLDVTNHTGTIPSARLSGTYNISITGSARYA